MTAIEKFNIAYKLTMQIERGYSFIPSDKGGETYNGISRVNHPTWQGWIIIDARKKVKPLSRFEVIIDNNLDMLVKTFYKIIFFDANNLGSINNQDIINEVYDSGVNLGVVVAAKLLQEALNLINKNQKSFKDIPVDGNIGPLTIATVNRADEKALLKTLNGLQFMRYKQICENDPTQEENFIGWLTRVEF